MEIGNIPQRCEIIPLPDDEVSLRIDGVECTRWVATPSAPRPCFFPLRGPSGESLTRMGHPGAPNHDHHRSVWFAHNKLLGINFWGNESPARIRQIQWLAYQDGSEEAALAVRLGWFDGHDPRPLIEQDMVAVLRPLEGGEYVLDLQSTFRPLAESIEFQQTNFGFLAVRVAKTISAHFGGGQLTNSEGAQGEPALFGKPALWMDYSGPIAVRREEGRRFVTEGITFFDHPDNPSHPCKWHVREDGWMGASACYDAPLNTTRSAPLKLRYLLHVHSGAIDQIRARDLWKHWRNQPALEVVKSTRKHEHFSLQPQS